ACLLVYSFLKTQAATKAEKRLDKANKELVDINEKLRIVGSLTRHDVQNKLAIIANNLYLAKLKLSPTHETINTFESVENNLDQIKYIFSFAGVYEKIGVEKRTMLNVGKCVDDAAKLLGLENVELINKCADLSVFADSLLTQIFYNLMHNSIVHGETMTQIKIYPEQNADNQKIVYEDNGVGIPENEKELIFSEGYGKGTGYGMFLVKKICDAYGWTINEAGEEGKGARFVMEIPKNRF
ncbi:MAG: sensor histidine kinase, partial [Candidatus Bathyarchaeota archaeon]|nr:sensor histidine kinase [Candidatus Bathyarchaeota archaeon]